MTSIRSTILVRLSTNQFYHTGTATNVHSAIRRGLLKSRGTAFRGKSKPGPDDPREIYKKKHSLPDFTGLTGKPRPKFSIHARKDHSKPGGKESQWVSQKRSGSKFSLGREVTASSRSDKKLSPPWLADLRQTKSLRQTMKNDMERENFSHKSKPEDIGNHSLYTEKKRSEFGRKHYGLATSISPQSRYNYKTPYQRETDGNELEGESFMNRKSRRAIQFGKQNNHTRTFQLHNSHKDVSFNYKNDKGHFMDKQERINRQFPKMPPDFQDKLDLTPPKDKFEVTQKKDQKYPFMKTSKSFPISIPYTTSASEFLYGTSVVESILSSKQTRRELYKLYIYSGENREDIEKDEYFQRLAKEKGVKVEKVSNDWIRILDKMSNGRPHNGYVLETSPLPKLPVQSLGKFITCGDPITEKHEGFEVNLDHQSREEIAINGTSNFIQVEKSLKGKRPLVILLDHILDPGNLGGIIRTASFFGISAIAISTRNCAAITPVVSKASAGATETTVLLSVQNSVEFIIESKKAGWHVFAAVTPPVSGNTITSPKIFSLNERENVDNLPDVPSIIMIGSEGDGLRRNLCSKADYQVYIPGSPESSIDNLNVSVATGIVCYILSQRSPNFQSSSKSGQVNKPLNSTVGEILDNIVIPKTQEQQEYPRTEEQDQSALF